MIALPAKFRIKIYNGTGVALAAADVNVKVCFQKFASDATVVEGTVQTIYQNAGSVANATYDVGAWIDNSTTKNVAFHGLCYTNTTGAPNGAVKVYLENSTDGTAAPSDGRGWVLIEIPHTAAGATTRPVRI